MPVRRSPLERFVMLAEVTDECWRWQGYLDRDGYGLFAAGYPLGTVRAARYAYERFVGPIPDDLEIDHLCKNRSCVRPSHLTPATRKQNARRTHKAEQTHCANGHPFDDANTYIKPSGQRQCRACHVAREKAPAARTRRAEASRRYRERKRLREPAQ